MAYSTSTKIAIAAVALVAAGFGAAQLWRSSPQPASAPPKSTASVDHSSPEVAAPTRPEASSTSASGNEVRVLPSVVSKMQADFESATDWRAFAFAARSRPAEGGYFYAMRAADLCGRDMAALQKIGRDNLSREISSTGTAEGKRLQLLDRFEARCASFSPGEASALYKEVREQARDGKDPLLGARQHVLDATKGSDVAAVKAAASEILGLRDGTVLSQDQLLVRLMSYGSKKGAEASYWFAGQEYAQSNPTQSAELMMAVELAACQVSSTCSLNEQIVATCITNTGCQVEPAKYLRTAYLAGGGTEESFNRALTLAGQMHAAIASRSVESFVRAN